MKKIYSLILVAIALFAVQSVKADDDTTTAPYTEKNNIAYSKYPTGPVNGVYTIHLNTFVTGEKTVTLSKIPADVVLVLDVSGSMSENYTTYTYTARDEQDYAPNTIRYGGYYYLHTDGVYYEVSRGGSWGNRTIQFNDGTTTYYLVGTGITGSVPTGYSGDTNIWRGVLYTRQTNTTTRLAALKTAVGDFIDVIKQNAVDNNLDNQIAIVKFAMNAYYDSEESLAEGDHGYYYSSSLPNANYTEVVKQFTKVAVADNAQDLKDAVNDLHAAGATAADYGMRKAELLLKKLNTDYPNRQSNKTVVLFTDGAPTYGNSFDNTVANNTISKALTIKGIKAYTDTENNTDVYTTVFTVGVFDDLTSQISTYMNYTSSNYPNASNMNSPGTGGSDKGFFQNASDSDLSAIFRSIAQSAGGSQATTVTATAATTVDVVSQSFDLPDGASTNIGVYFANCTGRDDENGYLTFDTENRIANPDEGEEGHVTITIDEATQKVTASGFDYSGNWCGKDESLGENQYHGMMLMLEIPIEMADDAVGGNNVGTNGPESGIYVNGEPLIKFDIPEINLPTNLHIKKEIADGECATFYIYRKKLTDTSNEWGSIFKTVIIIGGKNDNTVKLMGLDPTYLYKIVEGEWSWAYEFEKITDSKGTTISAVNEVTSDKLITNPFIFVNKEKDTKIRHAESAVYNDFRINGAVQGIDSKPKTATTEGEGDEEEEGEEEAGGEEK